MPAALRSARISNSASVRANARTATAVAENDTSAPAFWTRLDAAHLWPVVGVCVGGLSSHWCLTNAYRHGEAIMVVPLDFLRLPLIAVVAWLLYGEALDFFVFLGSAIIIFGIILNLRAEARR